MTLCLPPGGNIVIEANKHTNVADHEKTGRLWWKISKREWLIFLAT
jgi:hypothetical protein